MLFIQIRISSLTIFFLVGLDMRILSLSFFLTLIFYNIAHALPKCEGDDDTKWTNCKGTYLKKEIVNGQTRDYTGEFGSIAGERQGMGSSIVYKNEKIILSFVGEFKNNKPNGQGSQTYEDGSKYIGEWKDGKLNGRATWINNIGVKKYVGEWKDNLFHGIGTNIPSKGNKYFGEFKDGKRNGVGTYTYANGAKYLGEWKDNLFNGHGNFTASNGDNYIGGWKDDKKYGQGTYTAGIGDKYVGEFKDGKFHGQGTYTWADGKRKYIGEWKGDNFYGQGTFTKKDGTKDEGKWINNKLVE
jgi:hypothetical protein